MDTHVFYSPHTDDEAIGMAGSILRAKREGHRVILVLVTDNLPSARARSFFVDYPRDLTAARLAEWHHSLGVLEVDECRYLALAEQVMVEDRAYAMALLLGTFGAFDYEFRKADGAVVHHTVLGVSDIHRELGRGTMAHAVCEEVANLFAKAHPSTDVFLHAIYVYSFPPAERTAPIILDLSDDELAAKRQVLDCYKAGEDRIGYGYASVPELFDAAATDSREYMVKL